MLSTAGLTAHNGLLRQSAWQPLCSCLVKHLMNRILPHKLTFARLMKNPQSHVQQLMLLRCQTGQTCIVSCRRNCITPQLLRACLRISCARCLIRTCTLMCPAAMHALLPSLMNAWLCSCGVLRWPQGGLAFNARH